MRKPLHSGWALTPASADGVPDRITTIPATVPGCVHTDLLAAGLIPDPFVDDNETALAWIGDAAWRYTTTFDWHGPGGHDRVDLVCEGLDTVADLELNGVPLGSTANMHRSYRFDVRDGLRPGANDLRITFHPAREYARHWQERLGDRPNAYPEPFNFIRKMACNFGWDWGPTLVTAGIWQPIGLDLWHTARLAQVRPLTTVKDHTGRVEVHADIERASEGPLTLTAAIAGHHASTTVDNSTATVTVEVADPRRWWPRGYGDPDRYDLEVTLTDAAGTKLDTWHRKVGFRDVRLDTTPDEHGTPFTVTVNDQPIFVRGVNWIPDDPFPSRITKQRLAKRLDQATEANVNLLRVWGGGRYESDHFYDLADERGLMVTQDFLFACAAYPEEEPFATEVAAEAAEQVARLASHPSLLWWCGNNENIWGHADWGWQERLHDRTWGAGYYHRVLPEIVERLDPTRPYWPGSPWSGRADRHPNDPAHGTMHIWDVWNQLDYHHYRDHEPRFVAEFGYQAPPTWATVKESITDDPLAPDSPGMRHHQKAADGDKKLHRGLAQHFGDPATTDDWHYLTQVIQARAIQEAVEHFRALRPYCMGAIVWQLNDCWPVTSWSAIDGAGRRKPMWYALRRAYADRLLTLDDHRAVLVNETAEPWRTTLTVTRSTLDGKRLAVTDATIEVAPHSKASHDLADDLSHASDPTGEVLWAAADGQRAWWFYAEDKDIAYPKAEYDATVHHRQGETKLAVTARTFLRDLTVFPDRLNPDAEADDALRTLFPGETVTFTIRGATAAEDGLTTKPVLRCVND
ncbi:glycoside hydrolase family 2 TIM barrel-domain containing protein [Asanoa sp. WMMD1127]|uniref:glycoside hydrolase family 2 protein n=1 Tax=Asanoa sp. WMMD1127 TaxID=3016107 RepID=UPI002415D171|nr:glycoside hydrolase family 2 TIM barrel-domain containing protein [Asanoa sp. WMMD1127]MDG4823485.1 glycoside hydrolase family 2 TIM barrel-domain containing protein [Asanoa sp. WMMD1127]